MMRLSLVRSDYSVAPIEVASREIADDDSPRPEPFST